MLPCFEDLLIHWIFLFLTDTKLEIHISIDGEIKKMIAQKSGFAESGEGTSISTYALGGGGGSHKSVQLYKDYHFPIQ